MTATGETWSLSKSRFVKICGDRFFSHLFFQDKVLAAKYSVDEFPSLVFFENQIPSERKNVKHKSISKSIMLKRKNHFCLTKGVFDGELEKPAEVLAWVDDLLTGADIEQVIIIIIIIIMTFLLARILNRWGGSIIIIVIIVITIIIIFIIACVDDLLTGADVEQVARKTII